MDRGRRGAAEQVKRPSPKARPTQTCGTSDANVADLPIERNTPTDRCPWDCVLAGYHHGLVDRTQTPRATWCQVCDRVIGNAEWATIPTPRRS